MDTTIENNTEWTFDKGTTPEGNQRKVLDYLNDRVALVVDGYRAGRWVEDRTTIIGDDFSMKVDMYHIFSDRICEDMLYCTIDIHVTRHKSDGRTEESSIDYDGRFPFKYKGHPTDFSHVAEDYIMPNSYDAAFGLESIHTRPLIVSDTSDEEPQRGFLSRLFNSRKALAVS